MEQQQEGRWNILSMASTIETSLFLVLLFPVSIYVYTHTHTHTLFFIFTIHIWVRCPHYFLLKDEDAELKIVHLTLSLSHVWLFATPWIAARQASLSITNSRGSLRLTCIESVMPCSLSSPSPPAPNPSQYQSFPMSQLFTSGGQSTGVSASGSFPPKKSQGWSPSEWTGWTSLQSKGLSRVFSSTTVQKHQFFGTQLSSQSNSHIHTWPLEKP